jgi:hypothetical protein
MSAAKKLAKPGIQLIAFKNLILDLAIQCRCEIDKEWARTLSGFIMEGSIPPPVIVYEIRPGEYMVSEGFHRAIAFDMAGQQVRCEVRQGTERDAKIYSAGSNRDACGKKPMTTKDLKRAAEMLFEDPEWLARSAPSLADYIGIKSSSTIERWRSDWCRANDIPLPELIVTRAGSIIIPTRITKAEKLAGLRKDKDGKFRITVSGRNHSLGKDENQAVAKAKEILATEKLQQQKQYRSIGRTAIIHRLARQGISSIGSDSNTSNGFGSIVRTDSAIIIPMKISKSLVVLRDCICRAIFNRDEYLPGGRAIIVCYDLPTCRLLDIARERYGVEFMTPKEMFESLKPYVGGNGNGTPTPDSTNQPQGPSP